MGAPAAEWERPQSEGTGGKDGAGFEYRYENVVCLFQASIRVLSSRAEPKRSVCHFVSVRRIRTGPYLDGRQLTLVSELEINY